MGYLLKTYPDYIRVGCVTLLMVFYKLQGRRSELPSLRTVIKESRGVRLLILPVTGKTARKIEEKVHAACGASGGKGYRHSYFCLSICCGYRCDYGCTQTNNKYYLSHSFHRCHFLTQKLMDTKIKFLPYELT
jgi:hypothetical protein